MRGRKKQPEFMPDRINVFDIERLSFLYAMHQAEGQDFIAKYISWVEADKRTTYMEMFDLADIERAIISQFKDGITKLVTLIEKGSGHDPELKLMMGLIFLFLIKKMGIRRKVLAERYKRDYNIMYYHYMKSFTPRMERPGKVRNKIHAVCRELVKIGAGKINAQLKKDQDAGI